MGRAGDDDRLWWWKLCSDRKADEDFTFIHLPERPQRGRGAKAAGEAPSSASRQRQTGPAISGAAAELIKPR